MKCMLSRFPGKVKLEFSDDYGLNHENALAFLEMVCKEDKYIVWGVAVLNEHAEYTYDKWLYDSATGYENHHQSSYEAAREFIVAYGKTHQNLHHYVFTLEKADVVLPLQS